MSNIIESQVFSGELYIKASDHHRAVAAAVAQACPGPHMAPGIYTHTVQRVESGADPYIHPQPEVHAM